MGYLSQLVSKPERMCHKAHTADIGLGTLSAWRCDAHASSGDRPSRDWGRAPAKRPPVVRPPPQGPAVQARPLNGRGRSTSRGRATSRWPVGASDAAPLPAPHGGVVGWRIARFSLETLIDTLMQPTRARETPTGKPRRVHRQAVPQPALVAARARYSRAGRLHFHDDRAVARRGPFIGLRL